MAQAKKLKELKDACADANGAEVARLLKLIAGSHGTLANTLRAAASVIENELQMQADVQAGVPPATPLYLKGIYFDSGLAMSLQNALKKSEPKEGFPQTARRIRQVS